MHEHATARGSRVGQVTRASRPVALATLLTLFLLVAGMEVDLSTVWREGKAALKVGVCGIVVPWFLGFAAAYAFPKLVGAEPDAAAGPAAGCVNALKILRYDRERAAVQDEIDRLRDSSHDVDDGQLHVLWERKKDLLRRLEELNA